MSLWGGPARSSPLYHYGFGADAASLRLQRCCLQLRRGHAVPRCPRCLRVQRANSDSHFLSPVCELLRAIACIAARRAHWTVPDPWDERCGCPARADCAGRVLGDVGGANAHGRCAAAMVHYAMRIGHIGVTSFITNSSGKACRRPRKV